ncbi:hypothetical protein DFH28DRAFT_158796 [Melampsora americana]|nr:hypothetical protein DFH28DRAFT_158796 [Melampsora americana]
MTTPVLQKTFFILKKENERSSESNTDGSSNVLSEVMVRYEVKMREHIQLLEHEDKPKEVIDIFTKDEQEKLGGYGIQLEKKWSPNDEMELYKAWGSYMRLYISVNGTVKGILESQAIQVIWLNKDRFNVWDEMQVMVKNSLKKEYQDLTYELVTSIKSLERNIDSAEQLCQCQRKMPYGIFDPDPEEEEAIFDELDTIIFWVQNMPFYLEMISQKETQKYQ